MSAQVSQLQGKLKVLRNPAKAEFGRQKANRDFLFKEYPEI